ncbi:hypothetical protein E8E14_008177 [Neopestalotiopsis sp. 37M]|nr:hypothetical protein E8E14_008177 [Neopestalotiopsis sp. 37M]
MSALERFVRRNYSARTRREGLPAKPGPSPLRLVEDDSSRSLIRGRPKEIMNKLLTPTISHFSFDGTGLPFSRKSPSPRTQSTESLHSNDSAGDDNWDKAALLNLSDSVRASIRHDESLGVDAGKLSAFLETIIRDEERKHPTMTFEIIEYARLDKLLEELLHFSGLMKAASHTVELPLRFRVDISHSKKLRVLWRHRFREQYAMIDQLRCAVMVKGGRLKEVSFTSAVAYDLGMWQTAATNNQVGADEGNQVFEPGHWWLNIVCAQRDGIVGAPLEKATSGRYGITALPLLTGREEQISRHITKYIREGGPKDMHIPLISQVGQQIRVLRGYRLKSVFAPQAGLRYDGLYIIRQYGTKMNEMTNIYRLELTLERVANQKAIEELGRIPKPSQLDDWKLYAKLEGDKIKLTEGDAKFFEWSVQREEERLDREDYKRDCEFRASFS